VRLQNQLRLVSQWNNNSKTDNNTFTQSFTPHKQLKSKKPNQTTGVTQFASGGSHPQWLTIKNSPHATATASRSSLSFNISSHFGSGVIKAASKSSS
jgi:hypothetical protein